MVAQWLFAFEIEDLLYLVANVSRDPKNFRYNAFQLTVYLIIHGFILLLIHLNPPPAGIYPAQKLLRDGFQRLLPGW